MDIEQIQSSHKPIILTVNGKASVIMQDTASYQELLDELELARSAAKSRQGIAEAAAGKDKRRGRSTRRSTVKARNTSLELLQ